jgi:hypothetical protein
LQVEPPDKWLNELSTFDSAKEDVDTCEDKHNLPILSLSHLRCCLPAHLVPWAAIFYRTTKLIKVATTYMLEKGFIDAFGHGAKEKEYKMRQ